MYVGSIGSFPALVETLVRATPIMLVSQGLAVAFRARLWNIGAEGQLLIGGTVAGALGLYLHALPQPLAVPLILLASGLGGAVWIVIPALLRAYYEVNEIFTTLMSYYIALYFVSFLLSGPLRDPVGLFPETTTLPKEMMLPIIIKETRFHAGILIPLMIFGPLLYMVIGRSTVGVKLSMVGCNPTAAQYAGVDLKRVTVFSLLFSGFLAGLAGGVEVLGIQSKMRLDISPGYGFTGIVVALLGYMDPIGVMVASMIMGGLINGSTTMHRLDRVPVGMAFMIQAMVVIFVMVGYLLYDRFSRKVVGRVE
jgi:simple sugar transport system permease protein